MYNPAPFAETRISLLHEFIREHPLGTVVTHTAEAGLSASHVPMYLNAEAGPNGVLQCHLARANPQWEILAGAESVLVIFGGAEHYVSPSWYPSKAEHGKVVPTWNYAVVHVTGRPCVMGDGDLVSLLHRLTEVNEASLPERWRVEDAPYEYISALTNAIVGIEITILSIEGKWKHSQNRPAADRAGVIAGLEELGTERAAELARAMKR